MSEYQNPQEIWDSWIERRDLLLKKINALNEKREDAKRERRTIQNLWDETVTDLAVATYIKILGIKT